jgi:hypothetical protein
MSLIRNMNLTRHWKAFMLLSILGVIGLTGLSINLMEKHLRESFVFWIYIVLPAVAHTFGCFVVWLGVCVMRLNDSLSLFPKLSQLTWFLRIILAVSNICILSDLVQLMDLNLNYLPIPFAFGSGLFWVACYFKNLQTR